MAYFADGTPYEYSVPASDMREENVGWLDSTHDFTRGSTSANLAARIAWLCAYDSVNQTRGIHSCELCPTGAYADEAECYLVIDDKELHLLGTNEIRVPANGLSYAAPSLILHYLCDHDYLPPPGFIKAAEGLPRSLGATNWAVRFLKKSEVKAIRRAVR